MSVVLVSASFMDVIFYLSLLQPPRIYPTFRASSSELAGALLAPPVRSRMSLPKEVSRRAYAHGSSRVAASLGTNVHWPTLCPANLCRWTGGTRRRLRL